MKLGCFLKEIEMRIIHFMLSCFYIDGCSYQENILPRMNKQDGHCVKIVASCYSFDEKGEPTTTPPCSYVNEDGIPVTRLPYRSLLSRGLLRKASVFPGVSKILEGFKPDIVYFHGCGSWELKTVFAYKRKHPQMTLFLDSHVDRNNSASNWFSAVVLHSLFYRSILRSGLSLVEMVLCPSYECLSFCKDIYRVPEDKLEFYPLGGMIPSEEGIHKTAKAIRHEYGIDDEDVLFAHSGKMDPLKRTAEVVKAFKGLSGKKVHLFLIGTFTENTKSEIMELIADDPRIQYLGWKSASDLNALLCATDVYVQPGSQSATMQNSMCNGCALLLYPHISHSPYLKENGFFVRTEEDIRREMEYLANDIALLNSMKQKSYEIACELLDYHKLASRIYAKREV